MEEYIEIAKVTATKHGQLRITLKKKVAEALGVKGGDYVVFYEGKDGIYMKKLEVK